MTSAQTATLAPYAGAATTSLGYTIVGVEFQDVPVGLTTNIGISTGAWYKSNSAFIGAGATEYRITLSDVNQAAGISTGDIVKLMEHDSNPSLDSVELTVNSYTTSGGSSIIKLGGFTKTSVTNGGKNEDGSQNGYISIRKQFVIAKGRVGVI